MGLGNKIATSKNCHSVFVQDIKEVTWSCGNKLLLTASILTTEQNEKKMFTHKTRVKNVCAKGIFHVVFNIYILFVLIKIPCAMRAMHKYL